MPSTTLTCRQCGVAFTLTVEEEEGYKKFGFEPVPECFPCQQMHKLSFRNGRSLYRRTSDATGKPIISIYAQEGPYKVYEREEWYSDKWDALSYGREIDFSKTFFEQFRALQLQVPRLALLNVNPENSDYCNMCVDNKDSYCVFGGDYNQSVLYSVLGMHNKNCVDCDYSNHNELCHDVFNAFHCYDCRSTVDSKNCSNCAYISDCMGCRDCILCTNLQQQQCCIENVQLSKEEYVKRKEEFINDSWTAHMRNLEKLRLLRKKRIVKFTHTISCERCTGDFMENSKGCRNCFFCTDSEDAVDAIFVADAKDCFRCSFTGHKTELCYNCQAMILANRCSHCYFAIESSDCEYCDTVTNCKNCFGCTNIRHKQYCILNKQYAKQEYEQLREKLVAHMKKTGEWGEFFPKNVSAFAYNESTAPEFFSVTEEEARKRGFSWRTQPEEPLQVSKIISAEQMPDRLRDIPDDVLQWAIQCEKTQRLFRIVKQELDFFRQRNIPLPRLHPDVRFKDRLSSYSNPPKLYPRTCAQCSKALQTTYAPDRPEIIYCEECYLKAVY